MFYVAVGIHDAPNKTKTKIISCFSYMYLCMLILVFLGLCVGEMLNHFTNITK